MGKINKEKTAFVWCGTIKSLRIILNLQLWRLKCTDLARRIKGLPPLTLLEYLQEIY